jgi:hypothetical protein
MPQITAQAKVFRDWDAVLGACTQNAALLPGVDALKADMEGLMAQAKDLKVQQETLEGQRRGVTQKLEKAIQDGRESARKLRAFALIKLGTDNMALSQFGVKPRVRRGRKAKTPGTPTPTPPPPTSQPPTSQPAAHSPTTVTTQGKEESHV